MAKVRARLFHPIGLRAPAGASPGPEANARAREGANARPRDAAKLGATETRESDDVAASSDGAARAVREAAPAARRASDLAPTPSIPIRTRAERRRRVERRMRARGV